MTQKGGGIELQCRVVIARTTIMNTGQVHCYAPRPPTPDLLMEITNSRMFLIQRLSVSNISNLNSYFTASKNSTTRQTDESWRSIRFSVPFIKNCSSGLR